ncbi:MAG: YbaB/EbfC family nucleoid-associated protein [Candidatus Kerfeldbacteria bacterium]|nr:YbaB/EbfC family nucleoid-associated protein [Candidatus Kerfeldbacteria bacterium]
MAVFSKLKQFRDLRSQAKKLQSELALETVHVDRMGGELQLIMDGNQQVLSVDLSPDVLKPEQKERLQNELREPVNDAVKKIQRKMAQKMAREGKLDLSNVFGKKE